MSAVRKDGQSGFRKDVDFVAKDEDEQVAVGIVMVPDAVDLQYDFVREETIREFAEQFGNFMEVGEADGGVMHAVWPSEHTELVRNEVLDEAEEIGGVTAPAGAWIQAYKFLDDELWGLVRDGILAGYSIGAVDVHWAGPFEQDELEDVDAPDEIDDDELVWQIVNGIIREVSAVDIPAVPDAQILETKALEKRLADHLGNRDGFIEEAMDRGHSEAEAERLWEYLNGAVNIEGAGEPGKESVFARAGKAFLSALTGSDSRADDGSGATSSPEDLDHSASAAKEGRTLSRQNRESLFATIDASLDVLHDAGVDHGMTRFTDRDDWAFDLSEHTARSWPDDEEDEDEDEDEDEEQEASRSEPAPGGDTPDSTTMSDDNPMADAPDWAKALNDRIDSLEESDKDADDPLADAPDWAKDLAGRVDEIEEKTTDDDKPEWAKALEERVDNISKQTGATESQQLGGAEKNGQDGELGKRQKFFIPESKRRGL